MAHLLVKNKNRHTRRRVELGLEPLTIGRAPSNRLILPGADVSRSHCVIEPVEGGGQIVDVGSRYGVCVNKRTRKKAMLRHGDRIQIGSYEIVYQNEAAPPGDAMRIDLDGEGTEIDGAAQGNLQETLVGAEAIVDPSLDTLRSEIDQFRQRSSSRDHALTARLTALTARTHYLEEQRETLRRRAEEAERDLAHTAQQLQDAEPPPPVSDTDLRREAIQRQLETALKQLAALEDCLEEACRTEQVALERATEAEGARDALRAEAEAAMDALRPEAEAAMDALRAEAEAARTEREDTAARLFEQQRDAQSLGAALTDARRSVDETVNEREALACTVRTLEAELGKLRESRTVEQGASETAAVRRQQLDAELEQLRRERDEIAAERTAIEQERDEIARRLEIAAGELATQKSAVETRESELTAIREELTRARDELAAASSSHDADTAEHHGLQQRLETLTAERDRLAKAERAAAAERDELFDEYEQLHTERDEFAGRCDELDAERARLTEEHATLRVEREELAGQLEQLDAEREAAAGQLEQLRGDRDQLAQTHAALATEHDRLVEAERAMVARRSELSSKCDELVVQRDVLAEQRDEMAERIAKLESERDGLADRLETSRREHERELANVDRRESAAVGLAQDDLSMRLKEAEQTIARLRTELKTSTEERAALEQAREDMAAMEGRIVTQIFRSGDDVHYPEDRDTGTRLVVLIVLTIVIVACAVLAWLGLESRGYLDF